jgi:hypothetical protein
MVSPGIAAVGHDRLRLFLEPFFDVIHRRQQRLAVVYLLRELRSMVCPLRHPRYRQR